MFACPYYICNAEVELVLNSKSAILIEPTTESIVYTKNAHEKRSPASMTKIMSLKIIFDCYKDGKFKMEDLVTTSEYASSMGGSQIFLSVGEQMIVEDLIKSIIIASANDACVAMAEFTYGSEEAFVEQMNKEAKNLGLTNTNFVNCTGLPTNNHYTTAHDMALIACSLLNNHADEVLPISSRYDDYIREGTEKQFWLVNTNKLVRFVEGIDGLKTGWTVEAGYCLTATMCKNDIRFVAVAMGAETPQKRNSDIVNMLQYGVSNYEIVSLYNKDDSVKEVEDILSRPNKYHLVVPKDINILKRKGVDLGEVSTKINKNELEIYIDDKFFQSVKLEIKEVLSKANFLEIFLEIIGQMFG